MACSCAGSGRIDAVDREVEDLIAPQGASRGGCGVLRTERAVDDERDLALGDAAVGTQTMALEAGQVVVGLGRAYARVGPAHDHHVALSVQGKLEDPGGGRLVVEGLHTGQGPDG